MLIMVYTTWLMYVSTTLCLCTCLILRSILGGFSIVTSIIFKHFRILDMKFAYKYVQMHTLGGSASALVALRMCSLSTPGPPHTPRNTVEECLVWRLEPPPPPPRSWPELSLFPILARVGPALWEGFHPRGCNGVCEVCGSWM